MHAPLVRPGDRVAVVSTSGLVQPEFLERGIAMLRERYRVDDDARRVARHGYLAGDDAQRAAALIEAVRDREVRAIFATRGGYGAMRVLEIAGGALSNALARDPKPIVGYSDITALHALWARVGVRSVHASMVAAMGRGLVNDDEREGVFARLEGRAVPEWNALEVLRAGEASGIARGGNLALISALHGTPFALPLDGAVLFLEDIHEKPYRVDRMLTTLRLGGALRGVRGVVLGDFTECEPADEGVTTRAVLEERLGDLGVPVFAGGGFGHGARNRPIALGADVTMRTDGTIAFGP